MGCGASSCDVPAPPELSEEDIGADLEALVSLGANCTTDQGFKLQRGTYKSTNKDCMVKFRSKTEMGVMARLMSEVDKSTAAAGVNAKIRRELAVLQSFVHPNVCNWIGACQNEAEYQLITETENGSDLWDQIVGNSGLSESQATRTLAELSSALATMHQKQLCHRDVRPENVFTSTKGADGLFRCKLTGFHFARYAGKVEVLTTKVGTPFYVAPQVLISQYDHRCDVWSLGVVAYLALVAYPPFYGKTDEEILAKVAKGNFAFNPPDWKRFSEEAKNLCRGCLKMKVNDRMSMQAVSTFVRDTWQPSIDSA